MLKSSKAIGVLKTALASCLLVGSLKASALGGHTEGNGGDSCENRFKVVRDDIDAWILQGGPSGLKFPVGVSVGQYSTSLRAQIAKAKIECLDTVIEVNGQSKTCKNFVDKIGQAHIQCNFDRFNKTDESSQYVLVHHEYAGLAGLEVTKNGDSDYTISNQLSGFLEYQTVKKLVVRPQGDFPYSVAGLKWSSNRGQFSNGCLNTYGSYDSLQCNTEGKDSDGNPLVQIPDKGDELGSKAAQQCASIGGRLPTEPELERLVKSFEHTMDDDHRAKLTKNGLIALAQAFGESRIEFLKEAYWWSSSADGPDGDYAFMFHGYVGEVIINHRMLNDISVRCVKGP